MRKVDGSKFECKICAELEVYMSYRTAVRLGNHVRSQHPGVYDKVRKVYGSQPIWQTPYEEYMLSKIKTAEVDLINSPPHYNFGKFEVIDVLEDWFAGDPLLWQVGKYLARAGRKGEMLEDLQKAEWYLKRRIEKEKQSENKK